ncbi:MAG TPA: sugar translocase, partial [Clostridiales bacterium]|nr:sugar translocase [Clostridiales bacterium]
LRYPFSYSGDYLFTTWTTQRLNEGWIFNNSRCGYPFGSNFLDYPVPDFTSLLALKILGIIFNNSFEAINLYFLLGFPFVFIATYIISRKFELTPSIAFVSSVLYAFAPFHFMRLGHLFYTWYFVVPIFYYIGYKLFSAKSFRMPSKKYCFLYFLLLMFLSSFGVYYALFGVIIIGLSGLVGSFRSGQKVNFLVASIIVVCISLGVLFTITPNIIHKYSNGVNPEVAARSPSESEIYAFKIPQLILPRPEHNITKLANLTKKYNQTFPLINENAKSSLGIVGTCGFIILFFATILVLSGREIDMRFRFLSITVFTLFLFGTIGGFGTLFALFISPSIRAWNRVSIFISYGTILAFFIVFQKSIKSFYKIDQNFASILFAFTVLIIGLYDQTSFPNINANNLIKTNFEADKKFIDAIEKTLPDGATIYQLPYMAFPEVPPINNLPDYALGVGFIHSKHLRWSYGGMKGREGDLFYKALSNEPMTKQIEIIKKMGFAGIYIDRRGYEDNGDNIIDQITHILGTPPILSREDGQSLFFLLPNQIKPDFANMSSYEIMKTVGYIADKNGGKYYATLEEGIDFTKNGLPLFIKEISGLSGIEDWGRWSDANIAPTVKVEFNETLPNSFSLLLNAIAFGPNAGKTLTINIVKQTYNVQIPEGNPFSLKIDINLNGQKTNIIEFLPPKPTSPQELGLSEDERKLGIGFVKIFFLKNRQY